MFWHWPVFMANTEGGVVTEYLSVAGNTIAYDVAGQGHLVVLAHGIGDSRHSYRFLAPALAAQGYRVANVDIRGCGDSGLGWDDCSRAGIANDLVAVVRRLGGPAVIIGQSISGGAATIAAATAPDPVAGIVELAPFTRAQLLDFGGLVRVKRLRAGYLQMAQVIMRGKLANWTKHLDVALSVKPADWSGGLARIETKLSAPGRVKALQSMCKTSPVDPGRQLPNVKCPVLVIEGAGHYPHVRTPDKVFGPTPPSLNRTLTRA
jgi:pimeloyl-ACP methyl ester carboxylesterase